MSGWVCMLKSPAELTNMPIPDNVAAALERLGIERPNSPRSRTNPYTKVTHSLVPDAVQLYDFITTKAHVCIGKKGKTTSQTFIMSEWNDARYYFSERWPDEYFDLID